ncbi:MAG TPA: ABC transporter permease [Elusimicrobiota bacterium]|nr:ABC transporter permease [Elusimicrobiota bacterium]
MVSASASVSSNFERRLLRLLGGPFLSLAETMGRIVILVRQTLFWIRSANLHAVTEQIVAMGVDSLPVTMLTSLFTGMVLALQTGFSFRKVFNEPIYVGTVVGLSLTKELGPVLTAVVVSGRVGAAIAAELGTMKVTEQLDALYTLGTNPVRYLAVPRFIACLVSIPVLTMMADFIGVLGGWVIAVYRLQVPSTAYMNEIRQLGWKETSHGIIKSAFFAAIIVIISCYKGFTCEGGAEGVGKATTSAVVISMVLILVLDYFLSALLVSVGIG